MGPSPINNWTEKNKGDSLSQTALQEYVKNTYLAASQVSVYFFRSRVVS